ncbi:MAG: TIGR04552 family protein [Candidatus Peregrinibacteria bacterium]|nr:TIGR04552 family protein [Candidatus Peregrinibacteria bacterium]
MGKKDTQIEFESFAAELNAASPFRHTLRGLGLNGNPTNEVPPDQLLDLLTSMISERVVGTIQSQLGEDDKLDLPTLRSLIAADITPLLKPLVKDDKKGTISMLDVVTLGLTDIPQVKKFLKRHGSDLDNPKDLQYVHDVLQEAIGFFDKVIARNPQEKIHPSLRNTTNTDGISHVFQTAAGKHQRQLVPQACALLRITAAIDFLNRDPMLGVLSEAQEELEKLYRKYFSTVKGKTYFKTGTPGEIPLEIVKAEQRIKERTRMIAKLLHKPQNNTKEVVDHIGLRVTTKSASDALKFMYFAFFKPDTAIFPGMTIRIDETKQLLFNEEKLLEALQSPRKASALIKELSVPTPDYSDLTTVGDEEGGANKHSSKKYKAIQITFDLPLTDKNGKKVHFPVEIQIVDQASREVNEAEAPHGDYMQRQTAAVRKRILESNNILTRFVEQRAKKGDKEE